MPASQVQSVGVHIIRGRLHQWPAARSDDLLRQGRGNCAGQLVLQRKHVGERAFIRLRPEMVSVADTYQLRREADPVPRLPNASLQEGAHPELLADVASVNVPALEHER